MLSRTPYRPAFTNSYILRATAASPLTVPSYSHRRVVNTSVIPAQLLSFILEQESSLKSLPLGARAQLVAETIEDIKSYLPLSSSPRSNHHPHHQQQTTVAAAKKKTMMMNNDQLLQQQKKDNDILATSLLPLLASALAYPDVPLWELAQPFNNINNGNKSNSSSAKKIKQMNLDSAKKKRALVRKTHDSIYAASIAATSPNTSSKHSSNILLFNDILMDVYLNKKKNNSKDDATAAAAQDTPEQQQKQPRWGRRVKRPVQKPGPKAKKAAALAAAAAQQKNRPAAAEVLPPIPATIFDSYTSTFHHHLLANWKIGVDIVPAELRLATIFELIRKHGLQDDYTTDQIIQGLKTAKSQSNAHRDEFVYSYEREQYYHRRLITDRSLHPLLLNGSERDLRCLSWILFFDSMKSYRFPNRPKKDAAPHYARAYARINQRYDYLPFMQRFATVLLDPDFETGSVVRHARTDYLKDIYHASTTKRNQLALKELMNRRAELKMAEATAAAKLKKTSSSSSSSIKNNKKSSSSTSSSSPLQAKIRSSPSLSTSSSSTSVNNSSSSSNLSTEAWKTFTENFLVKNNSNRAADPIAQLVELRGAEALKQHIARDEENKERERIRAENQRKLSKRYSFTTITTAAGESSKQSKAFHVLQVRQDRKTKQSDTDTTSVSLSRLTAKQKREQLAAAREEKRRQLLKLKFKKAEEQRQLKLQQKQKLKAQRLVALKSSNSKKTTATSSSSLSVRGRPRKQGILKHEQRKREAAERKRYNKTMLQQKKAALMSLRKARQLNAKKLTFATNTLRKYRKMLLSQRSVAKKIELSILRKEAELTLRRVTAEFKKKKRLFKKMHSDIILKFKVRKNQKKSATTASSATRKKNASSSSSTSATTKNKQKTTKKKSSSSSSSKKKTNNNNSSTTKTLARKTKKSSTSSAATRLSKNAAASSANKKKKTKTARSSSKNKISPSASSKLKKKAAASSSSISRKIKKAAIASSNKKKNVKKSTTVAKKKKSTGKK